MDDPDRQQELHQTREAARRIYTQTSELRCPYFGTSIALTADGFYHIQYKTNRNPRSVAEQLLKLRLLKKALYVIPRAGTLQEYRLAVEKADRPGRDGFYKTKQVEYWAFHAILGDEKKIKIKVILRRVGDGKITFWSVMPHQKFKRQKFYTAGIEDE